MSEGWNTRDGRQVEPVRQQGADLAELQRQQQGKKRGRASLEAEARQSAEAQRRRLEERARRDRWREQLQQLSASRAVRALVLLAIAAVLVWTLLLPRLNGLLHPPLGRSELNRSLPQITLAAARALGGDARPQVLEGGDRWMVTYRLDRGAELFNGRRVRQRCAVSYRVDRRQHADGPLAFQRVLLRRCR